MGQPAAPVRLNSEVPAELERIIGRALEKDRSLRYQSAAEIGAELRRLRRSLETQRLMAAAAAEPAVASPPRMLAIVALLIVAAAALGGWLLKDSAPARA
jgi:hypothetical protein